MSTLEFEEKTVEEAIAAACDKLGMPQEKLEIEIISRESSGIFGIFGAEKAKIRVTPKQAPVESAVQHAKDVLTRILKHIELPTVVEAESTDDQITLNIISNGSGLLIGKRGKTLQALQYLVSKIPDAGSRPRETRSVPPVPPCTHPPSRPLPRSPLPSSQARPDSILRGVSGRSLASRVHDRAHRSASAQADGFILQSGSRRALIQ